MAVYDVRLFYVKDLSKEIFKSLFHVEVMPVRIHVAPEREVVDWYVLRCYAFFNGIIANYALFIAQSIKGFSNVAYVDRVSPPIWQILGSSFPGCALSPIKATSGLC